jgi:hypothetical protein
MDRVKEHYSAKSSGLIYHKDSAKNKTPLRSYWVLAVVLLVLAGMTYRFLSSHFKYLAANPIKLPVPLSAFPTKIGDWVGMELPIPTTTREYMEKNFADDFLSRRYTNRTSSAWADVYFVYCSSRPGGIVGHKPLVCYPAHGWIHDGSEPSQFMTSSGQQIPCLIHRFHKPGPLDDQAVVLSFYILNGRLTVQESDFAGFLGRRPNIANEPARYVAQIQISSAIEGSIRSAAKDITDLICDFLPDSNGRVRAKDFINTTATVVK